MNEIGEKGLRAEEDSFGVVQVPRDKLYGIHTQRSLNHFPGLSSPLPPAFIVALAKVKRAAAMANCALGKLPKEKCDLIVRVCDEIMNGAHMDNFLLGVAQSGSGTESNMNLNEVIARRGTHLSRVEGQEIGLHCNDDVNMSQSSNDSIPTAMHVYFDAELRRRFLPSLQAFELALTSKAHEFSRFLKVGRTHLMDAVPMTLGQEFSGFSSTIRFWTGRAKELSPLLRILPIGGTAVGTGMNGHPDFARQFCGFLGDAERCEFLETDNHFSANSTNNTILLFGSLVKNLAGAVMKIASDIKLLASGPRCGFEELVLPAHDAGSSIMPGKVNPAQAECLSMICVRVMSNDLVLSMSESHGQLQLNTYRPLIIHTLAESIHWLAAGLDSFRQHCLEGIAVNGVTLRRNIANSVMIATALNESIGYDMATKITKKAILEHRTIKEVALEMTSLTEQQFERLVEPLLSV